MGTNSHIAKLKARLDLAIIQREHWKQLAENRNSIVVTEVCPESRSVEEYIIDADSVRASWRLIREYREQIEALRAENAKLRTALAEQGERQEAIGRIGQSHGCIVRFPVWNTEDGSEPPAGTMLYTSPQPGPDVRALAAALYQACGAYDMPERILDALSAAANGEPFAHMIDGLLPCVPPSDQDVQSLVEALEECAASLAWNCFGECRAVHAGPIMPAAKALDTARAALAYHRQAQTKESEK